jgi:hypothetical protein
VNPYLTVTLVMCGVIFIALAATAYLAVYFTRRAKADLAAALTPLAEVLQGQSNPEEGEVTGRYNGKLAFGRVANAEGSLVRVFETEVIDSAGGEKWLFVRYPRKDVTEYRPEGAPVFAALPALQRSDLAATLGIHTEWLQIDYSPEKGHVRLTVPMGTRKDIPTADSFIHQLNLLDSLSDENRAWQEAQSHG